MSTSQMEELNNILQSPNLVILTLGNSMMGDDAVGVIIAEELHSRLPTLKVINAQTVPANFLGVIVNFNPDTILVIDAIDANLSLGELVIFDQDMIEDSKSTSTHYQEFSKLLKYLSIELTEMPIIHFLGIQIKSTDLLTPLSMEVEDCKDALIDYFVSFFSS